MSLFYYICRMGKTLLIILGILLSPFLLPGVIAFFVVNLLLTIIGFIPEELSIGLGVVAGIYTTVSWLEFLFRVVF